MDPFSIIAGVGLLTQFVGGIMAGSAQAEAAERNARLKNQQADELLAREAINEQIMREQGERTVLGYQAAFSDTGREGGGIGGALTIHREVERSILNARRDAEFKARMIRAGAAEDVRLAGDLRTASILSGFGGVMSGAADIYMRHGVSKKIQDLPKWENWDPWAPTQKAVT